ncbi:type II toxin-antitoxin system RelB/DinJ family antitoxin [Candidatus Peregrinibacteria bacterium]|nr:type II toxin-antitoxin system RelB/DinJ family antitoxin [Candidatus Peregrinibacteria bacterium]
MANKNLQVRIDVKLRRRAEKIFKKIGIDTPTAIRVFFMKVTDIGGIPFPLEAPRKEFTSRQIKEFDRIARDAKQGKRVSRIFSSMDEMIEDLRS